MSKRTLLLADDSVTIQKVVNLTFADEGIEVITVSDGDAAMEKISQSIPDVILADVHMPGLSGYQICEALRENPATKDLPVVLLVGSFEPFDESEAARVGANAYLTKPFQSIRQLVSQVTDLMRPAEDSAYETTAEHGQAPELPETTDIENLYEQSVAEPTMAEVDAGTPRYVDAGMDDDMIEASSAAGGEIADAEYSGDVSLTDSDYVGRESRPEAEHVGSDALGDPSYASNDSSPGAGYAGGDSSLEAATPFDGYADDRNESSQQWAAAAAPATVAEPTEEPPVAAFDEFSRAEQIPVFEEHPTRKEFTLDEGELLELPPLDNGKTMEVANEHRMISDSIDKQIDNLSPELMDRIVQRVVEKLSEKK